MNQQKDMFILKIIKKLKLLLLIHLVLKELYLLQQLVIFNFIKISLFLPSSYAIFKMKISINYYYYVYFLYIILYLYYIYINCYIIYFIIIFHISINSISINFTKLVCIEIVKIKFCFNSSKFIPVINYKSSREVIIFLVPS